MKPRMRRSLTSLHIVLMFLSLYYHYHIITTQPLTCLLESWKSFSVVCLKSTLSKSLNWLPESEDPDFS